MMKTISLAVLVSFLVVSGLALASQSGQQKERPSSMQEMMKGDKDGEHMGGMMRMMKMMDQCSAMMESAQTDAGREKESQEQ
jgi:Spy/CpxP family protein refolding chaperone